MYDWILSIGLLDPVLLWPFYLLSAALVVYLLARRPTLRRVLLTLVGMLAGAALALVFVIIANATSMFGRTLEWQTTVWGVCGLAAVGLAVVNLWGGRWWRTVIAAISIVVFLLTLTLGVNAFYGLNRNVAAFFGITVSNPIPLPTGTPTATNDPDVPLYQSWEPPADMPATGRQSTTAIPGTKSGFAAREAGVYLPPAALTANPPALPLVILMMGQPGTTDPSYIANVLDPLAAANKGLAPVVLVVDQLGDPQVDPACANSTRFGNVETYITEDVVDYANTLPFVDRDHSSWIIAGYSNGGACAFKYAAEHPDIWPNLLSISGELYAGSEHPQQTTNDVFGGDSAAFEASKPTSILASGTVAYPSSWALFTAGENDPDYVAQAQQGAAAAKAAGWDAEAYVVPGAGHVVDALEGGLAEGFKRLYPRLGLAPS